MPAPELQGRDEELAAIAEVLDAVGGGGRRLLVLRGEAGIGKTLLLTHLREQAAARRLVVLESRGSEHEQDVPLVPVLDALEERLRSVPDRVLLGLGDEALQRLSSVLPGLPGTAAGPPAAASGREAGTERWRLHRALARLVGVVGTGSPTVLVVDDVHWADPATLEFLEHLVRRPPAEPHLLALATRPAPAVRRLLTGHRAGNDGSAVTLDLRPLPRSAAAGLLDAIPAADERERLYVESGGRVRRAAPGPPRRGATQAYARVAGRARRGS